MAKKKSSIQLKLNTSLQGHPKGAIIRLKASDGKIPDEAYWRARIKDAKIDNCVEVVQAPRSQGGKPA